ncbi:MAG: hypothetical protein GYA71_02625 [Bacteroidales bacterium]|jgi:Fur family peroxide stress response transcriptional regulator|nr:hypothetical protein [Bacteroidales bacterium]OQB58143.1 MAG: Ferric uptake regulator family protein [Bacteroidetes bacterium ADurb.Bin145]
MSTEILHEKLKHSGLKVTPQRITIYETVLKLKNHPTTEKIIEYIKKNNPNILLMR